MQKARETIERHAMLVPGDRVGIAVSGGADSVALVHLLSGLAGAYSLTLMILHLNHGVRGGEADRDEQFVATMARSMGFSFDSERISVPKLRQQRGGGSVEDICRQERYAFFDRMVRKYALDRIALGHTLSDQAETVLMRFLRGSGLEGLKGFLPLRDGIYIRPLMEVTRDRVASYLEERDIPFVTDSSNKDTQYLRNRIRAELVPELKGSYNANLEETVGHTTEILRVEDDFVRESVAKIITEWEIDTEEARLSLTRLKELHPALLWRLIKTILESHSPLQNGIGYRHVKAVVDLINASGPNVSVDLPFNLAARREYGDLVVGPKESASAMRDFSCEVRIPGDVYVPGTGKRVVFEQAAVTEADLSSRNPVFMDCHAVSPPLVIRNIRPGDRIQPLGMRGMKKVARILMDAKIPKTRRRAMPLLADRKSVLWVPGLRLSERVRVTDMTEKVVKAEII